MNQHLVKPAHLLAFQKYLREQERSTGTIENYLRSVRAFTAWVPDACATKEAAAAWKKSLCDRSYRPGTVNGMIAAVNQFFLFMGWRECRLKPLRVQKLLFRDDSRELTREEYLRLLAAARGQKKTRLALLLETIGGTGIRVSELRYITVEAVRRGKAEIRLKGKIRVILLPERLAQKLLRYAKKQKITTGAIFCTRTGKVISRKQVWAQMKALCKAAQVAPSKVFPHNLRHLFARTFYKVSRDIAQLSDVLGHSSIETTRIYLLSTGIEHRQRLERLGLVS